MLASDTGNIEAPHALALISVFELAMSLMMLGRPDEACEHFRLKVDASHKAALQMACC